MAISVIVIVFILDQFSKYYIETNAQLFHHLEIIPNFFYLRYLKNTGAAWSMLSNHTSLLTVVSIVEIGILIYFLIDVMKKKQKWLVFAISLMIGGALGNLFDRFFLHYVRDFLDFYIFGYDFPVFNIADSALCVGAFILIVWMIFEPKKGEKA